MQKVEYRLSVFNRFMLAAMGSAFITPGPFSIFRSSVVRELGGWRHGHSTEDMEMALRMQAAGFLIGNAPKAIVHTAFRARSNICSANASAGRTDFCATPSITAHMIGNRTYGNLGVLILPTALISILAGIYFFVRIMYYLSSRSWQRDNTHRSDGCFAASEFRPVLCKYEHDVVLGIVRGSRPHSAFDIAPGSFIGTGKRNLPIGTPLFVLFYSFLVPLWLGTAVVRAVFKTGVRWR